MRRGAVLGESGLARIPALMPALGLVLTLAGCSGGNDRPAANVQLMAAVRSGVAARAAGRGAPEAMTRARLDALGPGPFLEATREKTGQTAYLFVNAERPDRGGGAVTVWRTEDAVTLALRGGVLIATRGLGGDVLSTEMQAPPSGRPGPAAGGQRVQHIRDSDDGVVPLALACAAAEIGPETLDVLGRRYPTRHLRERCEGGGGIVINDYWIDSPPGPGGGAVRQSRQWGGPYVGYLRLRRLTD